MGMGDAKFELREIFDRSVSEGDFLVGMSGRGDIGNSEYMIYTPYKTKFIINPILFPYELEKRINVYDNLGYSSFVENNFSFNKGNHYFKIENMDSLEYSIYEKFKLYYDTRMEAIDCYNKIRKSLPIGSIVSDRNTFKPMIYLGKASNYYTLRNIENINSYYIQTGIKDYHIYAELNYNLDNKFNFNEIISNKVSILDIMEALSNSYFINIKRGIPKNHFYLGYIDVTPLFGNFDSDNVTIYYDSNRKELKPLDSLYKNKNKCIMFTYASYIKIFLEY